MHLVAEIRQQIVQRLAGGKTRTPLRPGRFGHEICPLVIAGRYTESAAARSSKTQRMRCRADGRSRSASRAESLRIT
jgi:hypothetical protein